MKTNDHDSILPAFIKPFEIQNLPNVAYAKKQAKNWQERFDRSGGKIEKFSKLAAVYTERHNKLVKYYTARAARA